MASPNTSMESSQSGLSSTNTAVISSTTTSIATPPWGEGPPPGFQSWIEHGWTEPAATTVLSTVFASSAPPSSTPSSSIISLTSSTSSTVSPLLSTSLTWTTAVIPAAQSTSAVTTPTAPAETQTSSTPTPSSASLSTADKIGIGLGAGLGSLVLIGLIVAVVLLWKRIPKQKPTPDAAFGKDARNNDASESGASTIHEADAACERAEAPGMVFNPRVATNHSTTRWFDTAADNGSPRELDASEVVRYELSAQEEKDEAEKALVTSIIDGKHEVEGS